MIGDKDTVDQVMTVAEVAERCGVHPKTVARAIRAGRLRASRLGTRGAYRMRVADVELWFGSSIVEPVQDQLPGMAWEPRRPRERGRLVVGDQMGKVA